MQPGTDRAQHAQQYKSPILCSFSGPDQTPLPKVDIAEKHTQRIGPYLVSPQQWQVGKAIQQRNAKGFGGGG